MANQIARLGVVLGLDSAEFVKGLEAAGKKLEAFSKQIETYGKVAAGALLAASYAALSYADEIADTAAANDLAIDSVLKLSNALAMNGGKAENAGKMLAGFSKHIDSAATGSEAAQLAFKKTGVSLSDIANLSTQKLLDKTLSGLANIADPMTRNAKAMEFFGKAARGVDFSKLNEDIKSGAGVTEEQAKAIKDAGDAYDMLTANARKFMELLSVSLGPTLKTTLEYFQKIKGENSLLGEALLVTFQTLAVLGANVVFVFQTVGDDIGRFVEHMKALATWDVAGYEKIRAKVAQDAQQRRKELDEFEKRILGIGKSTQAILNSGSPADTPGTTKRDVIDKDLAERGKKIAEAAKAELELKFALAKIGLSELQILELEYIKKTESLKLDQQKANSLEKNRFTKENQRKLDAELLKEKVDYDAKVFSKTNENFLKNLEEQRVIQEEFAQNAATLEDSYNRAYEAQTETNALSKIRIDTQHALFLLEQKGLMLKKEDYDLSIELFNIATAHKQNLREIERNRELGYEGQKKAIADENTLYEKQIELATARKDIIVATTKSGTFGEGFNKAMMEFYRDMPTEMQRGGEAFVSVMGSMNSALDNFVKTGKVSFSSLAQSIIRDLIAIQLKAQASMIFKSALSFLGNMFGGGGAEQLSGPGFSPRAEGGPVSAGNSFLVGERGPELFVPQRSGTVIPNNQMAAAMGGGQTVNYNGPYIASMSAIDTQSGVQFLARNKNTIWASYQSANRSIPVSR